MASVSGGGINTASFAESSVSGGNQNTASGESSSVSGGAGNAAMSRASWIGGGFLNQTFSKGVAKEEGIWASIFGGKEKKTAIDYEATP